MGAEREDTDPNPKRVGTEPGLAPSAARGGPTPAAAAPSMQQDAAPVDFDALHAALGDPLELDDEPVTAPHPTLEATDELDDDDLEPGEERVGESSGRSSATYASARPHTIPPTQMPTEDLNAPPVIVASDDTVPTAPPPMTVPLAQPPAVPVGRGSGPRPAVTPPASGPQAASPGHVSSGRHPSAEPARSGRQPNAPPTPAYPFTPPAFPAHGQRVGPQLTMRMPDRPINPRRQRTATVVVRSRGPSRRQKLLAFMAMLVLVTACGIAVIIWRKPTWVGLEPADIPSATASASASGALAPANASGAGTGPTITPVGTTSGAPAVSPRIKSTRPPAAPTTAAPR